MIVPLFYNADSLALGLGCSASLVKWDTQRCPNLVFTGNSGSGKTYALQLALARISKNFSTARAIVCDFKNQDFRFLEGYPGYFAFKDCFDGLRRFYSIFEARQANEDTARDFYVMVFSEWSAWLSTLDKRQGEEARQSLGTLISLVRGSNMSVWLDLQRADASWLGTSSRDSLSPISLGTISPEAQQMLFPAFKDQMKPAGRGEGYFSDGATLTRIVVPEVQRPYELRAAITRLVT